MDIIGVEKRVGGGAYSWSQLQPRQGIGCALLIKLCNQVTRANLPHPQRLTCQNAYLVTQFDDKKKKKKTMKETMDM